MKALAPALRRAIWVIITLLVIPAGVIAQEAGDSDQEYKFSKEELTQMLAPIALYPDALTAQILMASTYPLEVVEADRWRSQNLQLKGDDLDKALLNKNWDPSIKSLCHFPDILKSMSDKLDQTRKLGDAFLGQEKEVMTTVQELRSKAKDQGNLKTTGEQKVIVEEDHIRIESANPEVIYVPVYDPAYVFGPWWYADYPPYYWYYPSGFYSRAYIGFGPGIYFGFNAFSWSWFDWPRYRVHIDIDRTRRFNQLRDRRHDSGNVWSHNPRHRRGVAYRDLRTSDRFGSRAPRVTLPSSQERRGYSAGRIEQRDLRQTAPKVHQAPVTGTRLPQYAAKAQLRHGCSPYLTVHNARWCGILPSGESTKGVSSARQVSAAGPATAAMKSDSSLAVSPAARCSSGEAAARAMMGKVTVHEDIGNIRSV